MTGIGGFNRFFEHNLNANKIQKTEVKNEWSNKSDVTQKNDDLFKSAKVDNFGEYFIGNFEESFEEVSDSFKEGFAKFFDGLKYSVSRKIDENKNLLIDDEHNNLISGSKEFFVETPTYPGNSEMIKEKLGIKEKNDSE